MPDLGGASYGRISWALSPPLFKGRHNCFKPYVATQCEAGADHSRRSGSARQQRDRLRFWEWTPLESDGIALRITATLAQHGPDGTEHITGTGDTLPQAGLHKIIARYRGRIDFAFLHLGVAKLPLFRGQAVSMSASHAVDFAKYEDWAHFSEGRTAAAELFAAARCQDRVIWLEPRPSQVSV
jgi:hypothetical protein